MQAMLAGYDHLLRAAQRARWDDATLDLAADAAGFAALEPPAARAVRTLVAGFCVAESAVAEHLEPFEEAAGDETLRRCFAAQRDDERRHARFFGRVARDVVGLDDPHAECPPGVLDLFARELPQTAAALAAGEAGLDRAVGLYHLVLEGIAFAVGQEALGALLEGRPGLAATAEGVARTRGDERWHVGLGVTVLSRLGGAPPDVDALAVRAARCWGAVGVDPDAILERHRRRTALALPA